MTNDSLEIRISKKNGSERLVMNDLPEEVMELAEATFIGGLIMGTIPGFKTYYAWKANENIHSVVTMTGLDIAQLGAYTWTGYSLFNYLIG